MGFHLSLLRYILVFPAAELLSSIRSIFLMNSSRSPRRDLQDCSPALVLVSFINRLRATIHVQQHRSLRVFTGTMLSHVSTTVLWQTREHPSLLPHLYTVPTASEVEQRRSSCVRQISFSTAMDRLDNDPSCPSANRCVPVLTAPIIHASAALVDQ